MTNEDPTPEEINKALWSNEAFWQRFATDQAKDRAERRRREMLEQTSKVVYPVSAEDLPSLLDKPIYSYTRMNDPEIPEDTYSRYADVLKEMQEAVEEEE